MSIGRETVLLFNDEQGDLTTDNQNVIDIDRKVTSTNSKFGRR